MMTICQLTEKIQPEIDSMTNRFRITCLAQRKKNVNIAIKRT